MQPCCRGLLEGLDQASVTELHFLIGLTLIRLHTALQPSVQSSHVQHRVQHARLQDVIGFALTLGIHPPQADKSQHGVHGQVIDVY